MKSILNERLFEFLTQFSRPTYLVGGLVRDFLIDKNSVSTDIDVAAPIDTDEFISALHDFGVKEDAVYKRTHTVMFKMGGQRVEFTSFRSELYGKGGFHTPEKTFRTDDILEDAKRRDFKCNAVYYDIKNCEFVDVLGGIDDIKNKVLDTVDSAEKVFSHDGLRLMRLARFSGELGFTPTRKVISEARRLADNVLDISPERIYAELELILSADKKHVFSHKYGHYKALKVLDETRVLDRILPELTLGRDMAQRADFHNHDVLEHTLRTVKYAHPSVRLAALLHDIAKPYCKLKSGKYHGHDKEGERLVLEVLTRLKAPEKVKKETAFLTSYHMLDLKGDVRETKLRKFIATNFDLIDRLMLLKMADYRGCKDYSDEPSGNARWRALIKTMKNDGTPFSLKELKISANDLIKIGYNGAKIGQTLKELFDYAVVNPENNQKERLIALATERFKG